MPIKITADGLRKIYPKAPRAVIEDRVADWQRVLDKEGISHTRTRLSYFFSNIEHECGGFTIKDLTENTNYSHARVAQVWPNRYASEAAVRVRFGSEPGWQLKMIDEIYGNRMGNRPGTRDGSTYIGRGGPQWTGRDGYAELERRTGIPAVALPQRAAVHNLQPEVCAAFWAWKKLNVKADVGDFRGVVKLWNGGSNGMADRLVQMSGNDPIIARLAIVVDRVMPEAKALPGSPPTKAPPQEVIDETTKKERASQKAGAGGAVVGVGGEATKATTEHPIAWPSAFLSPFVTYTLIGAGVAIVIVSAIMIARKKAAVVANWF